MKLVNNKFRDLDQLKRFNKFNSKEDSIRLRLMREIEITNSVQN